VQRLENQQGVLEDDSFADGEPVKLLQDRSDVVLALHASDKACVLHFERLVNVETSCKCNSAAIWRMEIKNVTAH